MHAVLQPTNRRVTLCKQAVPKENIDPSHAGVETEPTEQDPLGKQRGLSLIGVSALSQ